MSGDEAIISIRDVHMRFGDKEVLNGVTFDVNRGETVVILGASGSGKSTLLRSVLGLNRPTSGEILLFGRSLAGANRAERRELLTQIGCSFQHGALFSGMTVGENVGFPLRQHTDLAESTIDIMVRLKLKQVGLAGAEDRLPSQLSGGMIKRAALARALAMDPALLLFDEPSAGLDPITAAGLDRLILEMKRVLPITLLVVTHELESAFLIADRMVLLDGGRVIADGSGAELRGSRHPRVRQFLDRQPDPERAAGLDDLESLTRGDGADASTS